MIYVFHAIANTAAFSYTVACAGQRVTTAAYQSEHLPFTHITHLSTNTHI